MVNFQIYSYRYLIKIIIFVLSKANENDIAYTLQNIKSSKGNINTILNSKTAMGKEVVITAFQKEKNHAYSKHAKSLDASILKKFNMHVTKDYSKITKQDMIDFFDGLITGRIKSMHNKHYKPSTIELFKTQLHKFFKWYTKQDNPEQTSWLEKNKKAYNYKTADDIFSPEEINKLINTCKNIRDKAIIAVLYDSAMRVSEFINTKLKNILRDAQGVVIEIEDGKTGKRKVPLTFSVKYLDEWLSIHPYVKDKNSALWLSRNGNKLTTNGIREMMIRLSNRSNINKKLYPHILRHSRCTVLGKTVTEQYLRIFAGWSKNSGMPAIYCHPTEQAVREQIMSIEPQKKIYTEEQVEKQFEQRFKVLEQQFQEKMRILDSQMAKTARSRVPEINSEQILQDYHRLRNGLIKIYEQMIAEGKFAEAEKFRKLAEQGFA